MKPIIRFFACVAAAIAILGAATFTTSCDLARQAQGAYNMVKCKYDYHSLTDVSVAGINTSKISLLDAPKILSLVSGITSDSGNASIPVGFVVNLDVQNPNSTEAFLSGLDYVLSIDGIDFTSGSVAQRVSIPSGATNLLPLAMSFDVATLLRGDSRDAVVGVVRNLVGLSGLNLGGGSNEPSKVTLDIRPSFDVAGYKVSSPVYIPVSFSFGGK